MILRAHIIICFALLLLIVVFNTHIQIQAAHTFILRPELGMNSSRSALSSASVLALSCPSVLMVVKIWAAFDLIVAR